MNFKRTLLVIYMAMANAPMCANGQSAAAAAGAGAGAPSYAKATADKGAGAINQKLNAEPLSFATKRHPNSLAYSPDGNYLAIANSGDASLSVFAVDKDTGKLISIKNSPFETDRGPVSVAYSSNGKWAAVVNNDASSITVFAVDITTGQLTRIRRSLFASTFETGEQPRAVAYSPNGKWLTAVNKEDGNLTIFAIDQISGKLTPIQGSPFSVFDDNNPHYSSIAYSPDGNWLAIGSHILTLCAVNQETGALTVMPAQSINRDTGEQTQTNNYPLTTEGSVKDSCIAFSPDGNWIVATNENSNILTVLSLNKDTGALTPVVGPPIVTGDAPSSVTFSPDNKWVAVTNAHSNNLSVFSFNKNTGRLTPVIGSPFPTDQTPTSVAYSPDNICLAVTNYRANSVWVYEVDQQTGTLSRITGQSLYNPIKHHKEAARVLGSGTTPILSAHVIHGPLYEYMVPEQAQEQQTTEDAQEKILNDAIAKTKRQRETKDADATALFKAIKDSNDNPNAIAQYLTPFTLNARDDQNRTPLIAAVSYKKTNIALHILKYQGILQESRYEKVAVHPDIKAVDIFGYTALKHAEIHRDNTLISALQDAMKQPIAKHSAEKGK